MGFSNGYDSGYSDAIEDVRNGKVAGLGPASGDDGGQKRYAVVLVEGGYFGELSNLATLPDDDVLRVTMADLGVDSASSDPQTMDFSPFADKLAPVVAFDIFWNISTGSISVTGPEGYNWSYLEQNASPGSGLAVALSVTGDTFTFS